MLVLALEVALTRAFSVLLRFHYVFLAVSLATCGLGLGGLVDYLLRQAPSRAVLAGAGLGAALLAVGGPAALFASPLSARLTCLWVVAACCLPAFLAAGVFLSRAFSCWGAYGGVLYFADLSAAALAATGAILALQAGGALNVIFWCGALGAFAAALVWRRQAVPLAALLLGALLIFAGLANRHLRFLDLPALPLAGDPLAKPLYQELADPSSGARRLYSEWNAFARTDVVAYVGPDGRLDPNADLYLYTDGEVPTNLIRFRGDLRELAERYAHFIGLYAFRVTKPQRVMLLGPGGGLDIWLALLVGAQHIDGAEVNPSIPRLVRRFRAFAGPVYDYQGVRIYVAEGRSFLRACRQHYDLIYLALTKTATTTSASMALVESYVHTVEAFREYYRHLTPSGAIAFICQEPWLLLRAMLTALQALQAEGLPRDRALDCLALASVPPEEYRLGPYRHLLLVFRRPLRASQAARLAKQALASGLVAVFFPGAYEPAPFSELRRADVSVRAFVTACNQRWRGAGQELIDFAPCSDDRPFVADLTWGVPQPLRQLLWGAGLGLFALMAAACAAAHPLRTPPLHLLWLVYFSGLGVAFMLVEVVLIQLFTLYLGYPVLSLTTILFGLLLGAGLGSLTSQRARPQRLGMVVAGAVAGLVALGLALLRLWPAAAEATLGWDVRWRTLLALACAAAFGFPMGVPFPSGLRLLVDGLGAEVVPWMWGLNGLASVLGSAASMTLAKLYGFGTTLWVGLAMYGLVVVWLGLSLAATRERQVT
jgi:hypothetical protein